MSIDHCENCNEKFDTDYTEHECLQYTKPSKSFRVLITEEIQHSIVLNATSEVQAEEKAREFLDLYERNQNIKQITVTPL